MDSIQHGDLSSVRASTTKLAMNLLQLRSATLLLSLGEHHLLVDPMLSPSGSMPGFKILGGGRRKNPLVELPAVADAALARATAVVLTHEHPDHFDRAALAWVKGHALPVWTNRIDAPSLEKKGLDVRRLEDGALGMRFESVRSRHGRGLFGWLMGPVTGYYFAHPGEPSVYLIGDSVLTESVLEAIDRLQPEVIVAPAGSANMGLGGDILFSVDELVTIVRRAPGIVVLNHLEALDHCPTTRAGLRARMESEGLLDKCRIPEDGEELHFSSKQGLEVTPRTPGRERPGLQKWLTAPFAGT